MPRTKAAVDEPVKHREIVPPVAIIDTVEPERYADQAVNNKPVHLVPVYRLYEVGTGAPADFLYAVDAREALDSGAYTDVEPGAPELTE